MPTARLSFGVAVVKGKIYAIGGYNDSGFLGVNEMYDPETDTWTAKASMPTIRANFGIAVYQNKIYVIGGSTTTKSNVTIETNINEVYDPATDTWETREPMPTARTIPACGNLNNKIHVIGGYRKAVDHYYFPLINEFVYLNEVYDPLTDSWSTAARPPSGICKHTYAVINNKIYGIFCVELSTFATQIYDAETDGWSTGENMSVAVLDASAGATTGINASDRIYVLGGFLHYENTSTDLNQIYDPKTNTWISGTPMPTPRFSLEVAVVNDALYAIGGGNADMMLTVNEKYTPADYIPEFPSWISFSVMIIAVLSLSVVYRRNLGKQLKKGSEQ